MSTRRNANVEEQSIVDYVAERVAPHKKLEQGVRHLLLLLGYSHWLPSLL